MMILGILIVQERNLRSTCVRVRGEEVQCNCDDVWTHTTYYLLSPLSLSNNAPNGTQQQVSQTRSFPHFTNLNRS